MSDNNMRQVILTKLQEIERRENVRILHAVESGSRAWGFASPDSDYDVRFIYIRPPEFYLRLDKTRDVIEWQLDDTLDINGWDIQKALRLLHGANPTLFEWANSPIVYKTTPEWESLVPTLNRYFQRKAGLRHYFRTAKKNFHEYLQGDTVKLKKYFYALRPILACYWILQKQTPPPVPFAELTESCLDEALVPAVTELVRMKMETPELGVGKRIKAINDYLGASLKELDGRVRSVPGDAEVTWDELNQAFIHLCSHKW